MPTDNDIDAASADVLETTDTPAAPEVDDITTAAEVAESEATVAAPDVEAGAEVAVSDVEETGDGSEDPQPAEAAAPAGDEDDVDDEPPAPRGDRPAITAPKEIGDVPDELSADDFAAAIEQTVFEFKEGDIVAGTVVRVDPDEVLVDIGYKSEGVIPPYELSVRNNTNPSEIVSVGDEIEALVLQ